MSIYNSDWDKYEAAADMLYKALNQNKEPLYIPIFNNYMKIRFTSLYNDLESSGKRYMLCSYNIQFPNMQNTYLSKIAADQLYNEWIIADNQSNYCSLEKPEIISEDNKEMIKISFVHFDDRQLCKELFILKD